ncbi:MAG: hypothetical protein D6690_05120 [Nitrospirae bacterium]|nr:MAG: hypothetical protein D6690_05120 [Nitrospirota bacterium]
MTSTAVRSRTAVACLVGYVVLSGWLYLHAVHHMPQHAAHHAGTHASSLCSWWCAAGVFVHASEPVLNQAWTVSTLTEPVLYSFPRPNDLRAPSPRAPPRSSSAFLIRQ